MKKNDILASVAIGLISALIGFFILSFIGLELPIVGDYPILLFVILPIGAIGMIFVASLMSKKMPVLLQVARCFLAGVLNTLVDLGIFNLLFYILLPSVFPVFLTTQENFLIGSITFGALAFAGVKAISFSTGAINSYFWNKYWTFNKRDSESKTREFGKLYLVTLIGLAINVGAATFISEYIGPQFETTVKIWGNIAIVIAAFVSFAWNFVGYKFLVFKK